MTKHNLSPRERIELHTEQDSATGCWNWTGTLNSYGYGRLRYQYREHVAHRFAYETLVGPIPEGMWLDHLCLNRRCVNPEHLEVVTPAENLRRAIEIGYTHPNAPKTCRRGHDPAVYGRVRAGVKKDGSPRWVCAECRHASANACSRRRRAALAAQDQRP